MRSMHLALLVVVASVGCTKRSGAEQRGSKTFRIAVTTVPRIAGRVVLNGKTVHEFSAAGSQLTSDTAPCLLHAGTNTVTFEVSERSAGASVGSNLEEGHGLIRFEIRRVEGTPGSDRPPFRIDWSPDRPGRLPNDFQLADDQQPEDC